MIRSDPVAKLAVNGVFINIYWVKILLLASLSAMHTWSLGDQTWADQDQKQDVKKNNVL